MLGLPASTEIHKLITRKRVYEHFGADKLIDMLAEMMEKETDPEIRS